MSFEDLVRAIVRKELEKKGVGSIYALRPEQEAIVEVIKSFEDYCSRYFLEMQNVQKAIPYSSFLREFGTIEFRLPRRWGKTYLANYIRNYMPDGVILVDRENPLPNPESYIGRHLYISKIIVDEVNTLQDIYKWLDNVAPALRSGIPLIVRFYT